jgi:hypothetical protein
VAVDVNKLIADAKAKQAAARKAAAAAQAQASKEKIDAEVRARSKSQLDYANTLKPRLEQYESQLGIWARKIARGDKLSGVEQKEFDRLVKDYGSVTKAVDDAIKKSNDILVEARKKVAAKPTAPGQTPQLQDYTVNIKGKPTKLKWDPVKETLFSEDGSPYTGTVPWSDQTSTYKDGKRVSTTAAAEPKPTTGGTAGGGTAGGTTGGTTGGRTGGATGGGTTGGAGKEVPSNFNVGTFRKADEASMAGTDGTKPPVAKTPLDKLLAKTDFWYDLPDYIFKLDDKLGELLVEAVDKGWDEAKFLSKAKLTPWWQKNSSTIRTRIIDREKYNDLKAAGEDVTKSEYGLYLSKQMRSVKAKAKEIAGVTLTDEQAQSVAQKIYDGFLDDDPLAINALITPFIGQVTSIVGTGTKQTGFSGQALQNYQTLQGIAKANGFSLKDILPNVSALTAGGDLETAVLRGLADGSLDINRISQDARALAATGQPKYVRDLLNQGYDLQDVYAPYRKTMATELELNPDQIDLNDSTLRMAITDKGDMNLYDFKKSLRQDNRWQYTGTAKEEVSDAALRVLRDFGFQG